MAIIAHKGQCIIRGKRDGSVWNIGKVNPNTQQHPTEKPVDLIKRLIGKFSDEGDLVMDSYLGSGTTAVACKQLKRNFIGIEISGKYVEIANQRLRQNILL